MGLAVSLNNETLNVLHENSDEELYMKTGSLENKLHALFLSHLLCFLQLSIFFSSSKSENCLCHVFSLHICMFVVCSHKHVQSHVRVCTHVPICAYQAVIRFFSRLFFILSGRDLSLKRGLADLASPAS